MTDEVTAQQRFFEANEDLLERLELVERRAVRQSVSYAILEGWEPDREALALLVARAAGDLSGAEYRAQVRRRAASSAPSTAQPPRSSSRTR